jgi:acylphosphatase
MKKRIKCIISGRVQGVLYRAFARDTANDLDIKGEVENLPDGTVRIEAEGEEEPLDKFKSKLQKGSAFSKIENVVCDSYDDLLGYEDFRIKYKSFFDRF